MFPSTLSTFNRPTASDRLNSPSHSALHNTVSSALGQVEAVIGTLSSTQGTLMYDIRATASDGGGHIQSANKGGTGQTSYIKGDILVAQSSSVLSKLAIGSDGQVLAVDSGQSTGVKWGNAIAVNTVVSGQTTTGANLPQVAFIGSGSSVMSASTVGSITSFASSTLGIDKVAQRTRFTGSVIVSSVIAHFFPDGGGALNAAEVSIVEDSSGTPTGSVVANAINSVYGALSAAAGNIFNFSIPVELPSNNYWTVITMSSVSGNGHFVQGSQTGGSSTFGYRRNATWSVIGDPRAKIDMIFKEVGGRVYVTDTQKPDFIKGDGFVITNTSVGGTAQLVSRYGGFPVTSFTSLNPGSIYYANGYGIISDTSVTSLKMGKALSTNNLFAFHSVF